MRTTGIQSIKDITASPTLRPSTSQARFAVKPGIHSGRPRTPFWGYWTWLHPKLGLHGNSRLASTLRNQFLRNLAKTHTNRDATSRPGPPLQAPTPSKYSTPS